MLNILSTEEKKKILMEYRLRLAVVSIFAVSALVFVSLVLLAPAYLLAVSKYNSASRDLAVLDAKYGGTTGQEKEIATQIRDINKKIQLLLGSDTDTRLTPPQAIEETLKNSNKSIKIVGIMYDPVLGNERIVLTGTALDRESLALFLETLKKDTTFTNVTLPISSYVKSANIDFSIVVERKGKLPAKK